MRNAAAVHFTECIAWRVGVCGRQGRSWECVLRGFLARIVQCMYLIVNGKYLFQYVTSDQMCNKDSITDFDVLECKQLPFEIYNICISNLYLFILRSLFFIFLFLFFFFCFFFAVILAHCDRDQQKKKKRKSKNQKTFIRPWSHTRAAHVRVERLRERRKERERGNGRGGC